MKDESGEPVTAANITLTDGTKVPVMLVFRDPEPSGDQPSELWEAAYGQLTRLATDPLTATMLAVNAHKNLTEQRRARQPAS